MKIKKIGNITLTEPLWWVNYDDVLGVQAEVEATINGGVLVWEQSRNITSVNMDLSSEDDAWQTESVKNLLKALIESSIGVTTTVTTTDDVIINVRFRHEVSGGAVKFERIIKTSLSEYYKCNLFLARV